MESIKLSSTVVFGFIVSYLFRNVDPYSIPAPVLKVILFSSVFMAVYLITQIILAFRRDYTNKD